MQPAGKPLLRRCIGMPPPAPQLCGRNACSARQISRLPRVLPEASYAQRGIWPCADFSLSSIPTVLHPAADRLDAASPNLVFTRTSVGDWLSLPSDTLAAVGPLLATRCGQRTSETA
jgi:hypothetical protein